MRILERTACFYCSGEVHIMTAGVRQTEIPGIHRAFRQETLWAEDLPVPRQELVQVGTEAAYSQEEGASTGFSCKDTLTYPLVPHLLGRC